MIWEKQNIDAYTVKELAARYGLDHITASILTRREVTSPQNICFFLEKDVRYLHNPFLLDSMAEAVERINLAIADGEKILLFGDRDVDGITSTVMLVETLRELGVEPEWQLPVGDENYGLTAEVIESAAVRGINLLITLDCGISNLDEIELANSHGIDTVVIDHHNPHEYLPDAVAVVNPKLEESEYPFRDLCGCAVTGKLIWALHFSRTKYFDASFCLLNIRPANESYTVEAVRLVNLVEQDRLVDDLVPGVISFERSRLADFLAGGEALVFNKELQESLFGKLFGQEAAIKMHDLQPTIVKSFPPLAGKSLLKIKELSKLVYYRAGPMAEIDMLSNLVISHIFKSESQLTEKLIEQMSYISLGTLADIMPLVNENRIFVKIGLENMSRCKSLGLRHLLVKRELYGRKLNSKDIGWNISPVINAAGRMGEPDKAARLLLSTDQAEIDALSDEIIALNKKRKSLGEQVWKTMIPKAKTCFEKTGNKMVMIAGKAIHRGITGIIAARLVTFFKVSALVVAVMEDKATGSLRSTRNFNAKDFLSHFEDILTDYGGHDMAAGFSLPAEKVDEFKERFYQVVAAMAPGEELAEKINIDAEIPLSYLTSALWNTVELLEPYGECNRPLYFMSRGLRVSNVDFMGKKEQEHVRLLLDAGATRWPAVLWSGAERVGRDFNQGDKVDIVYQLTKNIFQNTETLRLTIMDIKKSETPEREST